MCDRSFEECECDCHGQDNVFHVAPCCTRCPWCKKRIVTECAKAHVADCRDTRRKRIEETARRAAADPQEAWEAYCDRLGIDPL